MVAPTAKRTRSERKKAAKERAAADGVAAPAAEKGGGKQGGGGAGKGRPGSAASSRQPSSQRGASLDPERETLNNFSAVWNRTGKHPKSGTARICLFHFVRGSCNHDPCDFSHDPSLKLKGKEKEDAIYEMNIRFRSLMRKLRVKPKQRRSQAPELQHR